MAAPTIGNKTNSITTPVINTVTFSHNNGGGAKNYIFLLVGTNLSATFSGVTYNGVAMTKINETTDATLNYRWAWYKIAAPATGANNVVVTFGAAPYNPVSVFAWSVSDSGGEGNYVFDAANTSPNSTNITISADSIIVGAAIGGANTGKDITLNGSSRALEFTNNVNNYTYLSFSDTNLTAGSKTVSVSNSASVAGYYLEIKYLSSSNSSNFFF
jgi:hypothetical protein